MSKLKDIDYSILHPSCVLTVAKGLSKTVNESMTGKKYTIVTCF